MKTKVCIGCKEEKPITCFQLKFYKARNKHYRIGRCCDCYREQQKDTSKQWKTHNKESYAIKRRAYELERNKDPLTKQKLARNKKKYRETHRLKEQEYKKNYNEEHKEANRKYMRDYLRKYKKRRRKTDIKFRLDDRMSTNIRLSLNSNGKKGGKKWIVLVGYNINELMVHLESKFQEGMNWSNYGKWHIDHDIPLSWWKYNSPKDGKFKQAWSLANLQPMWGNENQSKSNHYAGKYMEGG